MHPILVRSIVRAAAVLSILGCVAAEPSREASASDWANDPNFFPIGVWLQSPSNAERFKAAGINLYVGLWRGPTEEQLATLRKAGMRVICGQNQFALSKKEDPIIAAWMHGDEPDNAQSRGQGQGYGPPITPEKIAEQYQKLRAADPSRPVLLNLGQGVAWDEYIGRGVRRNHPEDYPEYIKGCDIASFDIYPAVHDDPRVAGKLEFVGMGVERLARWAGPQKKVWNCLECTRISNPAVKPTPQQVRSEAWLALIHGSRGLIYFVHQFKPTFREAALLDDPEMVSAVTALNRQIQALAPVLNSPSLPRLGTVSTQPEDAPVAIMAKRAAGSTYLFAVGLRGGHTTASFRLSGLPAETSAEVLDESRRVEVRNGAFTDEFSAYGVHIYKMATPSTKP